MPLPKSLLRRPIRRISASSSTGQSRRQRCRTCNNLDPRGHASTVHPDDIERNAKTRLNLIVDALSLSQTKDVTNRGCRFCNVLVQALDVFFEKWRGARAKIHVEIVEKATIKVSIDGDRYTGEVIEIYAGSASRAPWPTLGTAHHIPTNSGSDDTFNFIRRCIQGCIANPKHTACRFTCKSAISAPKRLLDVGRATSPIRLVDTQGKTFQYAALSHCWGAGPGLATNKSNWAKLAFQVSFDALPPLFQDAVIITRQLGLRYIWIDSLCIIQDSLRDWEMESSKMSSIYQNSYITISATNSGDGNARCLSNRRKAVKIPYENTTKKELALRARMVLDHHPNIDPNGGPARPIGPLSSRAWALQEHVLSTRILHYTATELLFECKTSYRCECMPERKAYPTTPSLIPKAVSTKKISAVYEAWQHIIEKYSARHLTVPSDKFPAISGIASKIREATDSEYMAGLWKGNLASDLLWSVSPSKSIANSYALDTWRAPTFSWASIDSIVSYTHFDDEELEAFTPTIALLTSTTIPKGLNPLGTLSDASITIRGPVFEATLCSRQNGEDHSYLLLIKGTSSIPVTPDCLLVERGFQSEATGGNQLTTVRRAQFCESAHSFKAPVVCLGVARYDNLVSGLVLGISERVPAAWERIGTFTAGTEVMQNASEREMILV